MSRDSGALVWNPNSCQLSAPSSLVGGCLDAWIEFRITFLELNSKMDSGRQVFTVDLLERYAAKGRGVITCMAAGNDVILLGTSKGWINRHDFGLGDSYDIDLSAGHPGERSIHRVFVDPGGSHCIATVVGSGGANTFYTHAKWTKPCPLTKLKGLVVNAVTWNRQQIIEASTKAVILGTDNGQLHEMAVDEKAKREKYVKFLFELLELPEAFMSLQVVGELLATSLTRDNYIEISDHIYREKIIVADSLATWSQNLDLGLSVVDNPPDWRGSVLMDGLLGLSKPR